MDFRKTMIDTPFLQDGDPLLAGVLLCTFVDSPRHLNAGYFEMNYCRIIVVCSLTPLICTIVSSSRGVLVHMYVNSITY